MPDIWLTGEVFTGEILTDDLLERRRVNGERKVTELPLPDFAACIN